ncbi:regulator [uncultured archaeon]|nr:regulator [uncultured archaeon]
MILILEEYFKDLPVKKRIVEGLYSHGISVRNGKFYVGDMELSVTEVSKAFNVNRRTVYDTIRVIEEREEIRKVMAELRPVADIADIAPLLGNQVVLAYTSPGSFTASYGKFVDVIQKYGCYVKEVTGRNIGKSESFMRAIFYRTVPARIFDEMAAIEGIQKMIITTPENIHVEPVCNKCVVKVCPNKISTGVAESMYDL